MTRQWEKVEVMKRKTGNLRTTMRMGTGLEVLPNGQEHNGESCAASTSELSTHNCGLSLMKAQESIQQFCVQERMTDVEGNHFKMGVDDWDINSVQLHA